MESFIATIILFAGNFAPRGWAFCNGQILSIAQNTALFSLLGTTYGGDGRTTFALPDLRGRVAIGTEQGPGLSSINLGEQAGQEQVTILAANMPAHNHPLMASSAAGNSSNPANSLPANSGALDKEYSSGTNADVAMNVQAVGLSGGSQPLPTRDPYLGLNYIICLEGIFPPRN